jgi:hypothetical protein
MDFLNGIIMKNDINYLKIYLTVLPAIVFLLNTNAQTYELSSFMEYCSHTYSGFINPLYNPYNVNTVSSNYVSKDSLLQKKTLNRVYQQSSFSRLDSNGRFVYIEDSNPTFTFQIEIDYPPTTLDPSVDSGLNFNPNGYSHNPALCLSSFRLKTTKNGKLYNTVLWNYADDTRYMKKTRHTFFGDISRRIKTECISLQWPFFVRPVTILPANLIHHCMLAESTYPDTKMLRVDSIQTKDSAFYFSLHDNSANILFHFLIEFNYPYYFITQFRTEKSEQGRLTIMDQAVVHFDGRPHQYFLYDRTTHEVIFTSNWLYNSNGNVISVH